MTVSERVFGDVILNGGATPLVIGGEKPQSAGSGVETNVLARIRSTNKASVARATVLGSARTGDSFQLRIQDETVLTGEVTKTTPGVGARTRVVCFGVLHKLKQAQVDVTFDAVSATAALRQLSSAVGFDIKFQVQPTETISTSFKQKPADEIVSKITKLTDTITVVSPDNKLILTDAKTVGQTFNLSRIIDASPGSRRPQYESVQVIGNTPTAKRGLQARHLISSQPVLAEAGDGQPSFIYEDDSITSQTQANNTAQKLLKRLKKQQKGGFAAVIGRPEIRPFDTVVFPPAQGGSTFTVSEVTHKITENEGFITRLKLGGELT